MNKRRVNFGSSWRRKGDWTEDEDGLLQKLVRADAPIVDGCVPGRSKTACYTRARRLGLPRKRRRTFLYEGLGPLICRERGRPSPEDIAARLAEIPEDTRDLTGRLMGDPLPGRSAQDRYTARLDNGEVS